MFSAIMRSLSRSEETGLEEARRTSMKNELKETQKNSGQTKIEKREIFVRNQNMRRHRRLLTANSYFKAAHLYSSKIPLQSGFSFCPLKVETKYPTSNWIVLKATLKWNFLIPLKSGGSKWHFEVECERKKATSKWKSQSRKKVKCTTSTRKATFHKKKKATSKWKCTRPVVGAIQIFLVISQGPISES